MSECGYCKSKKGKKSKCGGCKKIFYCGKDCQTKHWRVIHKKYCKSIKNDNNYALNDEEKELLPLFYQWERYQFNTNRNLLNMELAKNKLYQQMMHNREITKQAETPSEELLFPVNSNNPTYMLNNHMYVILDAFDKDGDRKLNFEEWRTMLASITFDDHDKHDIQVKSIRSLWNAVCIDCELDECSALNSKQIVYSLETVAYLLTKRDGFCDEDSFIQKFDYSDKDTKVQAACSLLLRLYGCALSILFHSFTDMDIIHQLEVGITVIKFKIYENEEKELWKYYDRKKNNVYFDVFYLCKKDDNGVENIYLLIAICDDTKKCDMDILHTTDKYVYGDYNQIISFKRRFCLASLPSGVPNNSFGMKQHALLITKLICFFGMKPALCHSIYIGDGVHCGPIQKSRLVNEFNNMHGAGDVPPNYDCTTWKKIKIFSFTDEFDVK